MAIVHVVVIGRAGSPAPRTSPAVDAPSPLLHAPRRLLNDALTRTPTWSGEARTSPTGRSCATRCPPSPPAPPMCPRPTARRCRGPRTRDRPPARRVGLPASNVRLLGPPLHTEQLEDERLGKPTALAVFASDNLSSSAYATEEILRVLVPRGRHRRVLAGRAHHPGDAGGAGGADPVVPPDHQGVPDRRRRLHRHPRQLRDPARPGRRRGAAHRLRPHRRGVGRRRRRRAGLGRSRR